MATAADERHKDDEKREHKGVTVIYLGEPRALAYKPNEPVKDALVRALDLFGITTNRHLLALFSEAGDEITDEEQTMKDARVKAGAKLLLGQSKVKGGS